MKRALASLALIAALITPAAAYEVDRPHPLHVDSPDKLVAMMFATAMYVETSCPFMAYDTRMLSNALRETRHTLKDLDSAPFPALIQQQVDFLKMVSPKQACEALFRLYGPKGKAQLAGFVTRKR